MYNVLIVEDEEPKFVHIRRHIENLVGNCTIHHMKSVNSAIRYLENKLPDLLILDMSLPTFDITEEESGGRPQGFGGIEVLREMKIENWGCPTIVITGYSAFQRDDANRVSLDDLSKELLEEFPEFLRGVLHFNSSFSEWKTELQSIINLEGKS
ncbi:MAG: response regulator [Pseudomonadales bacterium]|nr:response regulator [Pseudomonadales bacterium]